MYALGRHSKVVGSSPTGGAQSFFFLLHPVLVSRSWFHGQTVFVLSKIDAKSTHTHTQFFFLFASSSFSFKKLGSRQDYLCQRLTQKKKTDVFLVCLHHSGWTADPQPTISESCLSFFVLLRLMQASAPRRMFRSRIEIKSSADTVFNKHIKFRVFSVRYLFIFLPH